MINKWNQRVFHRRLYGGQLKTVTFLKRGIDQRQGQVTKFIMYQCRRSSMHKTKEPIQNDMTADHRTVWHIPRSEMDRLGISDINATDRIIEVSNNSPLQTRWWQPESTTTIDIKLFENCIDVACLRVDPPANAPIPN